MEKPTILSAYVRFLENQIKSKDEKIDLLLRLLLSQNNQSKTNKLKISHSKKTG